MSKATKATKVATPEAKKAPNAISTHIRGYRSRYVPTMGVGKRGSLDNDDATAKTLRTMEPLTVVAIAETVLKMGKGELVARYSHLNPGMKRMNSGNMIRSAIKRGDVTTANLAAAIKKVA